MPDRSITWHQLEGLISRAEWINYREIAQLQIELSAPISSLFHLKLHQNSVGGVKSPANGGSASDNVSDCTVTGGDIDGCSN